MEKPILFSGPMVRALLNGSKTQTRRIIKNPEKYSNIRDCAFCYNRQPSDILWVRETWSSMYLDESMQESKYVFPDTCPDLIKVDGDGFHVFRKDGTEASPWMPSIHMPRAASRIFLEVTGIRVERLQEISEQDAIAEGIEPVDSFESGAGIYGGQMYRNYSKEGYTELSAVDSYRTLWESINGAGSWDLNPYCWVIEFKVTKPGTGNRTE